MAKLTKAIIKKYGISKKAWAVARGQSSAHKAIKTKTRRHYTMAKYRKHKSRKSSGGGMGGIVKILIGVAVAILIQVFAVPYIPIANGLVKSLIVVAVGILLMTFRGVPSFVKAGGAALATIELASVLRGFFGGVSGTVSTANSGLKVWG